MTDRPDVDTLVETASEALDWIADNQGGEFNICCQRCSAPFEHEGYAVAAPAEWFGLLDTQAKLARGISDLAARMTSKEYARVAETYARTSTQRAEAAEADRDRLREALENGDKLLSQAARRATKLEAALRGFVEFCETLAAEEGSPVFALYEQGRVALAGDGGGA